MSDVIHESGDSDDLEALFDSIVQANAQAAPEPGSGEIEGAPDAADEAPESMFAQIGHLTRKLHDTLRQLGYDKALEKAVETMPDTRDRLSYIAVMTEQAAERALTATEIAQPLQEKLESGATTLNAKWQQLVDNRLSVEEFKQLVTQTREYLTEVPQHTKATNAQLMEIMMAQDFQDLTGQVIKKVLDAAQALEKQLITLLVETTPVDKRDAVRPGLLEGPIVNASGRDDVVSSQEQVDELLESLGF